MLTQELLKELLHYNPDTGVFTWNVRDRKWFKSDRDHAAWNTRYSGKEGKSIRTCGGIKYAVLAIFEKNYYLHRLASLYMTGLMPLINDHDDGDGLNNRWDNLNKATSVTNAKNAKLPSDNKSGVIGVSWHKHSNKWRAVIVVDKKQIHLGMFNCLNEAARARKEAEIKYNFHPNHGNVRER